MKWPGNARAYQDGLLNSFAVGTNLAVIRGEKQLYRHMNGFADREAGKRVDEDTLFGSIHEPSPSPAFWP